MCFPACWTWDGLTCNYLQGHSQKKITRLSMVKFFSDVFSIFYTSPSKNKTTKTKKWLRQVPRLASYWLGPTPHLWEQEWRSGESAHLPPVWSGFKAGPVPYVGWVCCWLLPCSEGFSLGSLVCLPLQKPSSPNSNLTRKEDWHKKTS